MTKSRNIFITGCNRPNGIGFGLVKQILVKFKPEHLFATCRNPAEAKELNELASSNGNLHVVQLDITNTEKYGEVVSYVDEITCGEGINLLINNSAILTQPQGSIFELTKENLQNHFEVNATAPIFLTKAFLPLLEKASNRAGSTPSGIGKALIMNMSTKVASIDDNTSGGMYAYRSSKTALNMLTKCLSLELKDKGIVCIMMHPGWVQTEMGGKNAPLTVEDSVGGILSVVESMGADDNGRFLQFDGKPIPW